jgi:hypothetical protein
VNLSATEWRDEEGMTWLEHPAKIKLLLRVRDKRLPYPLSREEQDILFPYEKSLAIELHSDSIVADSENGDEQKFVSFLHFEGVAPRQYQNLFLAQMDRKGNQGRALRHKTTEARKSAIQYLDSYRDLESKVVGNLVLQGLSATQIVELSGPVVA